MISYNNYNPRDWKLPHDAFRPYQHESILWAIDTAGYGLLEAPTGSGKTGIACAGQVAGRTIAVCRTKNLQRVNYGDAYGAAVVYGKGNYRCAHPENAGASCAECLYDSKSMDQECRYSSRCPYLLAKWKAKRASFACLNYSYFLLTHQQDVVNLFLDEAHQIPDLVLDFVGCTIYQDDIKTWQLDDPPDANSENGGMLFKAAPAAEIVIPWLYKVNGVLIDILHTIREVDTILARKEVVKANYLVEKVERVLEALEMVPDDWFIMSGDAARKMKSGRRTPVLVCRPLTARHHRPAVFDNSARTLLMSATIGNPKVLAEELGIDEYKTRAVPNQWPANRRPVVILDAPKLNHQSEEEDYEKQADVIAKAILDCPSNWSGIVHVTRKREAGLLAERLARRGLEDRIWITPGWDGSYVPTDHQMQAWIDRRYRVPNSICIAFSMWEGVDLLDERICIVAKAPFAYLGDPYEKARMRYSGRFYLQRAAYQMEQGLGRTRRGRECDYDTITEKRGLVAIADGNWSRVKKYLSKSLQEAIVE